MKLDNLEKCLRELRKLNAPRVQSLFKGRNGVSNSNNMTEESKSISIVDYNEGN